MKSIEEIVFELLQTNECVVVPSFGGFIAKQRGARIDYEQGVAYPPSKEVAFNIQLKENDGLLINSYGLVNQLDYYESTRTIEQIVQHWNATIGAGNTLKLPKIGAFWKDAEGNIQFEQDRSFNLLLSSYGLEVVRFVPVETQHQVAHDSPEVKQEKSSFWKYAAVAAVAIPIAFYSIWIPVKTPVLESGMFSYQDFNPFKATKEGSFTVRKLNIAPLEKVKHETSYTDAYDAHQEPTQWYSNPEISPLTPQAFYCIAGCFSNENNAVRLKTKLVNLGFQACIVFEGGLYKVSLGSGFSEEAIAQIEEKAKALHVSYWILN
jgi:cell division septation protein DedD